MYSFLIDNKEWIFSGVGVAVLGWIIAMIFRRRRKEQSIKARNKSINIQTGDGAHITLSSLPKDQGNGQPDIQRATLEDVKEFDPKIQELISVLSGEAMNKSMASPLQMLISLVVFLVALGVLIVLIVKLIQWIIPLF